MASNSATTLYDDNNCNPLDLWWNIKQWYDTLVNCAKVVLFEVKKLLNLHLDPDVVPTKFIADFNVSIDYDWFQVPNPSTRKNILKRKSSQ